MISFSNGHVLNFACGAGALAFNGRGWPWERPLIWTKIIDPKLMTVVAKTVTRRPTKGFLKLWCPWRCVRLISGGAVNAIGLTNNGIDHWIEHDYPVAIKHGYKIAASISTDDFTEAEEMGKILSSLDLAYIEWNASCPNVDHQGQVDHIRDVLISLRNTCRHPIVVKLSYAQAMDVALITMLDEHSAVEAIHGINTVPWDDICPNMTSPVEKHTGRKGGVSGEQIFSHCEKALFNLISKTKTPIIAGGGIWSFKDVMTLEQSGASAFSIGTLFLRKPWAPKRIIKQYYGI